MIILLENQFIWSGNLPEILHSNAGRKFLTCKAKILVEYNVVIVYFVIIFACLLTVGTILLLFMDCVGVLNGANMLVSSFHDFFSIFNSRNGYFLDICLGFFESALDTEDWLLAIWF